MSRRYRPNAAKKDFVYSVKDVMKLYGVSQNTVSNWVASGLKPSVSKKPYLFRGAVLNRFQAERRARSRSQLRLGEFKCLACKVTCVPERASVRISSLKKGGFHGQAQCTDCGAVVWKILSETECDMLQNRLDPNTSEGTRDEGNGPFPGGIGISDDSAPDHAGLNERILFDWQAWAEQYDRQTQAKHLAAIRDFEVHVGGKYFRDITTSDAGGYRSALIEKAKLDKGDGGLSRSTIRHRASHIASFFDWLAKQEGFRSLVSLEGWFQLPKGLRAKSDVKPPKQYPSLEEAERALGTMPTRTMMERRDRAIFATAFVTGLREDALITLRRKHLDPDTKTALQEGDTMRAKNDKSYLACWFPRTDAFQDALLAWISEVDGRGMREEDALFPSNRDLLRLGHSPEPIAPMKTASTVDAVFKAAWRNSPISYTPHSARHALAKLGEKLCMTAEQRKAWSQSLGHETESITVQHYGKMSREQQCDIFEAFDRNEDWSPEELRLMLAYHEHDLTKGTAEFSRAQKLLNRFRDRSEPD